MQRDAMCNVQRQADVKMCYQKRQLGPRLVKTKQSGQEACRLGREASRGVMRQGKGQGEGQAAWQTTRHKYQRVTPIFTRKRLHFLVAAKILKRCDVTDYKTFDTSAKAAKSLPPMHWRQATKRPATCHTTLQSREWPHSELKLKKLKLSLLSSLV